MSDPFVELIRKMRDASRVDATLEPPAFAVPAKAAKKLGWGVCAGCSRGIRPGNTVWRHGRSFHAECAVMEALEFWRAA